MPAGPRALCAAALIGAISSVSAAQAAPPIARFVPSAPDPAHVFVLDSAHILSATAIAALQDSALALQAETKADVAWVTLPTLGGRTIEEAALYIGRTWRIGTPGNPGDPLRNRGLVVLYVPDKTKTAGSNFRIEVGNGLEGTITDSRSRSITTAMRENLRAKRYDSAYAAGWKVAAALVREDLAAHGPGAVAAAAAAQAPSAPARRSGNPLVGIIVVILVLAVLLIVLAVIASRRKRRSPTMVFNRDDDDDDERRRRSIWTAAALGSLASSSSDSDSSSDSGSSSSGGDFGGGGGFSGGGSSDSI